MIVAIAFCTLGLMLGMLLILLLLQFSVEFFLLC